MCEYNIGCWMLAHPWVAVVVVVVVVVILLLPYDMTRFTRTGKVYVRSRALLWSWEQGPHRTRLTLDGLLRLQQMLLKTMRWAWVQYQHRLWAGVREMLKQWIA